MGFEKVFDVIIGGAGFAGVAAALAGARAGMRTALVEKTVFPGGLGTSGLVNIYLPLCDGRGRQVLFGIAEELLKASIRYGPGEIPAGWGGRDGERTERYRVAFSPASCVLALDELLETAGVDIWYDTVITGALMTDGRVAGVSVFNKSGEGELRAAVTVDATGDADIAAAAGATVLTGRNNLSIWALQARLARAREAADTGDGGPLLDMVRLGGSDTGEGHPEGEPFYDGIDGSGVSRFVQRSRGLLRRHFAEVQRAGDRTGEFPVCLPSMAQYRTTRRIAGRAEMKNADVNRAGIPGAVGLIPSWCRTGRVWELPYGALVPGGVEGLLVAGRCISTEDGEAWNVARVIPAAAFTGEVAGTAAALSVAGKVVPGALPVTLLQDELHRRSIPLALAR